MYIQTYVSVKQQYLKKFARFVQTRKISPFCFLEKCQVNSALNTKEEDQSLKIMRKARHLYKDESIFIPLVAINIIRRKQKNCWSTCLFNSSTTKLPWIVWPRTFLPTIAYWGKHHFSPKKIVPFWLSRMLWKAFCNLYKIAQDFRRLKRSINEKTHLTLLLHWVGKHTNLS